MNAARSSASDRGTRMKKLAVHYNGWGEDWRLGTLADNGTQLLFEYSSQALKQGLELSPRHLKLRSEAYGDFPIHQQRLPGLLADALPDGWGLLLMDRLFRQHNITPSPLDRLALLGNRAMGALRFAPISNIDLPPAETSLLSIAQQSQALLSGQDTAALLTLLITGGSPQGARPKALIRYNLSTKEISTHPDAQGEPWLVKFQAYNEHKEVCAIEHWYAHLARSCGLDMPATEYFDLSPRLAGFGVAHFDRENEWRVPVHSLAGLLHADFRLPSVDYTTYLRATRLITHDEREVQKAFARTVFNVVFHNRDDHAKNFAYCLGQDRRWRLSPCYDLTFSDGPAGEHQADICGQGSDITRQHLLTLARQAGISNITAQQTIDLIVESAALARTTANDYPIRRKTQQHILRTIEAHRVAVAS